MGPARKFVVGIKGFRNEQLQTYFQNFHKNGNVSLPRGRIAILPRYHGMAFDCTRVAAGVCIQGAIPFSHGERKPVERYKYEFLTPGQTSGWRSTPEVWDVCSVIPCKLRFGVKHSWSLQKQRRALADRENDVTLFSHFDLSVPTEEKSMMQVPIMDLKHCVESFSCGIWSGKTKRKDFSHLRIRVPILHVNDLNGQRQCPLSSDFIPTQPVQPINRLNYSMPMYCPRLSLSYP